VLGDGDRAIGKVGESGVGLGKEWTRLREGGRAKEELREALRGS